MAASPGKYDKYVTYVRECTLADVVLVMIIGGDKGDGFSMQSVYPDSSFLPKVLREMAAAIEHDLNVA
jgi:hypothetical protein